MRKRVVVVRGSVLLALLVLALLAGYGVRERQRQAEAEAYYERVYDEITVGTPYPDAKRMLGVAEERVAPVEWPRSLGEVPGYADGLPLTVAVAGPVVWVPVGDGPATPAGAGRTQFRYVVSPQTEIWWRLWRVPGRHRWIAVAFLSDGSGGSLTVPTAIMKRSGAEERLPERS